MNKEKFVEELSRKLNCELDYAKKVSDLLEDNFIIGKKNKIKTINNFMENLNVDEEEANRLYDVSHSIIAKEIKNKIRHPFRNLDKW